MYAKLILRSARRSARDYLIYIVTMTICVTLFYAFLSVSSRFYKPDIGVEYHFTILSDGMKVAICTVTLLLLFLRPGGRPGNGTADHRPAVFC